MRILIACGGTAGHIFPGLALAEELRREDKNCSIIMVVSTRPRDKEYLKAAAPFKGMQIKTLSSSPLPYRISFKYIPFVLRLAWAHLESFYIMLRYRPQVVVGFGGYTSFAPLIIGRIIGTPLLIHEQNIIPGRANRLLARIADRIAVTFDDTNKFFSKGTQARGKIVKTGLPLRKHISDYGRNSSERFKTDTGKFTILILGGSQGAHNINELVLNCLSRMDIEGRRHLQVIHLCGKRDFRSVLAKYAALGIASRVFDFLEDMAGAYRTADLLIARSGASTIFEAATFGLPCLFIPYSWAGRHQKENALFLKRRGAALVLDERTSSCGELEKMLSELIANKSLRENLSQRIKLLQVPQASHNLKEEVFALYRGRYVRKQENCLRQ